MAVLAAMVLAGPAAAVMATDDEQALVEFLAEASAQQDVCYGYRIVITGAGSGTDVGSDRGVGVPVDPASCGTYAIFEATLQYVSETSESSDTASWSLVTNVPGLDADALDVSSGDLLGSRDDEAAFAVVASLPGLAAAHGGVPFLPVQPQEGEAPPEDELAVEGDSDAFRRRGGWAVLLGLGALGMFVGAGVSGVAATSTASVSRMVPQVGQAVVVDGWHAVVRGLITLEEDGDRWWELLLSDGTTTRWLVHTPGEAPQWSLWERIPIGRVNGSPGDVTVQLDDGSSFVQRGVGIANYRAEGSTDTPPAGRVTYRDYEGSQGLLSCEDFGGSWEASLGRPCGMPLPAASPAPNLGPPAPPPDSGGGG